MSPPEDFTLRVRRRLATIARELADEFSKHRDRQIQQAVIKLHEVARLLEEPVGDVKDTGELPAYKDPDDG